MKKLILAAMIMGVSGGVMAATGGEVNAADTTFELNSPIAQPTCSLVEKSNSRAFEAGATLTVGGVKVANNAKVTASFADDSVYDKAANLKVNGNTASPDMQVPFGDFKVNIDDDSAIDTTAKITVSAVCTAL